MKIIVLFAALLASAAWGQTAVNQGLPGKQGSWPVAISPQACTLLLPDGGTPYTTTTVNTSSVDIPAASNKNRYYIVICVSKQTATATALVKCRNDGTAPVMAVTNPGDVLGVGDCIVYATTRGVVTQQVKCISDTVTSYVTSYECI